MASALTSLCDVAVYEQGVWFLRLSVVLLLASFANYVSLPTKDKLLKTSAVAEVEEIQEAVAVPASEGAPSIQQGADISAPPLPDARTRKNKVSAGKAMKSKRRGKNAREGKSLKPIRRGGMRNRRRAASHGKPKTTSAGLVSGSNKIVQMANRQPPSIAGAPAYFRKGSVPTSRSKAPLADPVVANASVAARPPRSRSSAREPITISMHPSKIKHLQFSL